MKRTTQKPRGYLSQLVQPVLPGESVLQVPRGPLGRRGLETVPPPVIEEGVDSVARSAPTRHTLEGRQLQEPHTEVAIAPPPMPAEADRPSLPVLGIGPVQPEPDSLVVPRTDRPEKQPLQSPAAREASPAPGNAEAVSSRPIHEQQNASAPLTFSARSQDAPPDPRSQQPMPDENQQSTSIRTKETGTSARNPSVASRVSSHEPAPAPAVASRSLPLQPEDARASSRIAAGPRVRIGTIEIRTTPPQPSPAPVSIPPVPQVAPTSPRPGAQANAGGGDHLSRALAWSFGLVQG